jgi:hypothetical protein
VAISEGAISTDDLRKLPFAETFATAGFKATKHSWGRAGLHIKAVPRRYACKDGTEMKEADAAKPTRR